MAELKTSAGSTSISASGAITTSITQGEGQQVANVSSAEMRVPEFAFGDFRGEMGQANQVMDFAAQSAKSTFENAEVERALQITDEQESSRLQEQKRRNAVLQTKLDVRNKRIELGLSPEDEETLFQDELNKNLDSVDNQFTYSTRVGDNIASTREVLYDGALIDYKSTDGLSARIDSIKLKQTQRIKEISSNYFTTQAQDGGFNTIALAQTLNELDALVNSPEFITANGGQANAYDAGTKAKMQFVIDLGRTVDRPILEGLLNDLIANGDANGNPLATGPLGLTSDDAQELLKSMRPEWDYAETKAKQEQAEYAHQFSVGYHADLHQAKTVAQVRNVLKTATEQFQSGAISAREYDTFQQQAFAAQDEIVRKAEAERKAALERIQKEQEKLAIVNQSLSQGIKLNPDDRNAVTSVNYGYRQAAKRLAPNDINGRFALAKQFADQTGIIPEDGKRLISGLVNSDNPQMAQGAASMLQSMQVNQPDLFNQLDDRAQRRTRLLNNGIALTEVQHLERNAYASTPEQIKASNEAAAKLLKPGSQHALRIRDVFKDGSLALNPSGPQSLFDSFFNRPATADPVIPTSLRTDYERAFKEEYALHGNATVAKEKASADIRQNYAPVTRVVDGKVVYTDRLGWHQPRDQVQRIAIDNDIKTEVAAGDFPPEIKASIARGEYTLRSTFRSVPLSGRSVDGGHGVLGEATAYEVVLEHPAFAGTVLRDTSGKSIAVAYDYVAVDQARRDGQTQMARAEADRSRAQQQQEQRASEMRERTQQNRSASQARATSAYQTEINRAGQERGQVVSDLGEAVTRDNGNWNEIRERSR